MNESTPTQTPTAPRAPAPAAAPTAPIVSGPHPDLTIEQAAKMAEWAKEDLTSGKITEAQAEKIFNDLGTPPEQRIITEDTRTAEQRMLDQHFPPAKPEEFAIQWNAPGDTAPLSAEVKQFDQTVRGWLTELRLPREHGQAIINIVSKLAQQKMTPEQVEVYRDAETTRLREVLGDTYDERMELARQMIHEVDSRKPGLKAFLLRNGVGDTAGLVAMLVNHAPIYHARKGR